MSKQSSNIGDKRF